ncbi:MAG: hypothetical protein HYW48_10200 [Deltaproteobacteria bacterium]|nr:hypothetical protein [Deltaproteobacteria bacterium]
MSFIVLTALLGLGRKVAAEVRSVLVSHPLGLWLPAFMVRMRIVEPTVETNFRIPAAFRAGIGTTQRGIKHPMKLAMMANDGRQKLPP